MNMQEAIAKVIDGDDLRRDEMTDVMNQIMSGGATDAQIGAFLIALRMKGESVDEIAGAAAVMREKATPIATKHDVLVDTCGTGGDHSGTFNISTTAGTCRGPARACALPNTAIVRQRVKRQRGCAHGFGREYRGIARNREQVSRRGGHRIFVCSCIARGDEIRHRAAAGNWRANHF